MWNEKLNAGKHIVGTMIRVVHNPAVIRIAAASGLDFVMLDMEHGDFSLETVSIQAGVARTAGLGCFVRVPELARQCVSRALDAGADGVMVPMIESAAQARALADWSKYAPVGKRGFGSAGGHTGYASASKDAPAFMKAANETVLAIAQIELAEAVESVHDIAAVRGVDALLVGPSDLSISLGCPGDVMGAQVDRAIRRIAEAAKQAGKAFGIHGSDALLERWIPRGLDIVMSSLDINMLGAGMAAIAAKYG